MFAQEGPNMDHARHFHRYIRKIAACTVLALALFVTFGAPAKAQALPDYVIAEFGAPPPAISGPPNSALRAALKALVSHSIDQANWVSTQTATFDTIAASKDARVVWLLTDMMRFSWRPEFGAALVRTATEIIGQDLDTLRHSAEIIDHLIAWDIPAYPGYLRHKRAVYTNYLPGMERIFVRGDIDWQLVGWGGVGIDDRPFGSKDICSCIAAIDNPEVSTAAEATWLKDSDIVFGIEVNGEFRAYPRRIMEVREMVNDTLGGRDLGIPYCTLCGAAQAFFTDDLPRGVKRPILRTSGLLSRSNKVMYDLNTFSVFDTFLGKAVTGRLARRDVQLKQATVITTEWGTWKAAHPDTTVLIEELALGRDFDLRNTRDANGPIFPVGDVDPRLPVQEDVIGVTTASGTPIAFRRSAAFAALTAGQSVSFQNVRLALDGGGIRATDANGGDLGSHQAFWFAWSQFHPDTALWPQ
ncbi:DUF3179 domain-containing (seleno)protein [Tateyamaria sp.]|uniref:DUF3179 domain-containing (seleno)protein n=1 Tax=Tateyamaria sp. TaxID=1929288 RepID=UPI00329E0904